MTCEYAMMLLHLDRPGERTEAEDRSLEMHLRGCAACQRELQRIRRTSDPMDRIRSAAPPPVQAANEIRHIMDSISREQLPWSSLTDLVLSFAARPVVRIAYGAVALLTLSVMGSQLSPVESAGRVSPERSGPYIAYRVDVSALDDLGDLPLPAYVHASLGSGRVVEIAAFDLDRTARVLGQVMLQSMSLSSDQRRSLSNTLASLTRDVQPTIRFGKIGG